MMFYKKIKLNKEQKEAVQHGEGPLLIIAGAGTGKTTVLTERVKWLINQKLAKPQDILALTFTDKAAREMEERVDIALPIGLPQMWIMTFHSFGERILRQEAVHIGLDPGYHLMTEAESIIFFRKNLFKFDLNYFRPLGNPNKFINGMLAHFNRLRDEDISPKQYIVWAKAQSAKLKTQSKEDKINSEKYLELANGYKKYQELKQKESLMDFADLISNTLKLFRKRPNVLEQYTQQFKYILVDEFQDTNIAQNELAILLSGGKSNVSVVADDDQAIYRWRGAAISNVIHFKKRFETTKLIILTKNYRSTQRILDHSYKLIQFNNPDRLEVKESIDKKLKAAKKIQGEKIELIYTDRIENEADEVVKIIKSQKSKVKSEAGEEIYKWSDFAILVRANSHADPFTRALARHGIPYQFLGPGMLFRQGEVKDLIAYLKLLNDITDSVAAFRVLSMPIIKIPVRDLAAINSFSKKVALSLFEACEVVVAGKIDDKGHWSKQRNYGNYIPFISDITYKKLSAFVEMVYKHLELLPHESAGQILYYFIEDSGLLQKLTEYETRKQERQALNISKFFDKLKTYEVEHEDASVSAVIDWINMSMEMGESPLAVSIDWTRVDAVNILTIHSSKGLEFPVVFLTNLVTQRFPTSIRREQIPIPDELVKEILPEGDYHLQEERRLFYVGMTRARDRLILTASNYYGEGKRERKISPFVIETIGQEVTRVKREEKELKQLTFLEWKKDEEKYMDDVRPIIEYLSYSQLSNFMTCPLQYKYKYILKIPVPPSPAGSFGTSIHFTLQRFYKKIKNGEKLTVEDLLVIFNQVWLPIGYGTKQYEEKMKTRGKRILKGYFEKLHDPNIVPYDLEQIFKIRLTSYLRLGGKIDRVDETKSGKLEIIDYKTGRKPSKKKIDKDLQMTVYALAATDEGIYNKKVDEVILSFYFLETQEKVSTTRTNKQLKEAKEKIIETAKEIEGSNFTPKVGPWCDFCDFRLICEAWQ